MKNWLFLFLGSNAANVVIFLFAIIIWKNHSENIIDEVDDASLTPTDYTLRVRNIPKTWKVPELKEVLKKISPAINPDNIHIAKKFDDRIIFFRELIGKAKILKDARTIKYRALKAKLGNDLKEEEILEKVMDPTYDGDGDLN
jgi:hypothetical protein